MKCILGIYILLRGIINVQSLPTFQRELEIVLWEATRMSTL